MVKEILKLGNPRLYERSEEILPSEQEDIKIWVNDLHDTLMDFRNTYGAGRAVAAPQVGIKKRLLYMYLDKPFIFINPSLTFPDDETYILWDDCMSFPGLIVKVKRYKRAVIHYLDENFKSCEMSLEGGLSELLQHEYDHLDGILATMRAVDDKAFCMEQLKRDF